MNSLLFLGIAAGVVVFAATRESKKVRVALKKHYKVVGVLPKTISVLILIAQISELIKLLDHVSIVNVTGSLFLFAILAAAKSGTEGDWV